MSTPGSGEGDPPARSPGEGSLRQRWIRDIGPIVGGMALDLVDFATFGPIGLYGGLIAGGALGWWLAGLEGVSERNRVWVALVAGVYCALPFTEWLPAATLVAALLKVVRPDRPSSDR